MILNYLFFRSFLAHEWRSYLEVQACPWARGRGRGRTSSCTDRSMLTSPSWNFFRTRLMFPSLCSWNQIQSPVSNTWECQRWAFTFDFEKKRNIFTWILPTQVELVGPDMQWDPQCCSVGVGRHSFGETSWKLVNTVDNHFNPRPRW